MSSTSHGNSGCFRRQLSYLNVSLVLDATTPASLGCSIITFSIFKAMIITEMLLYSMSLFREVLLNRGITPTIA